MVLLRAIAMHTHKHNGQVLPLSMTSDHLTQLKSVDVWHFNIQNDQIRTHLIEQGPKSLGVGKWCYLKLTGML